MPLTCEGGRGEGDSGGGDLERVGRGEWRRREEGGGEKWGETEGGLRREGEVRPRVGEVRKEKKKKNGKGRILTGISRISLQP